MSYSHDNGYTPRTFDELVSATRVNLNNQMAMNYTTQGFLGTNYYKFYYGIHQLVQEIDVKCSEIFAKTTEYIPLTNQRIQRPSVSWPGLYDSFLSKGYIASAKKTEEVDAGKIFIAIDIVKPADPIPPNPPSPEWTEYQAKKAEILKLLSEFTCGGTVFTGSESGLVTLKNGQTHNFAYHLPDRKEVKVDVVIYKSLNVSMAIPNDEQIRKVIFDNIKANYRLGLNFEPQRYYSTCNAPWASSITFSYSLDNGSTWLTGVYASDFDELFEIGLEDIQVTVL